MKTIDTKGYLSAICEIAQSGEIVSTVISGGSMTPFLCSSRDTVYLRLPHRKLRKGDIVLFTRHNGDFVLHRIKKIKKDGYYMIGDRQTEKEGPVPLSQIRLLAVSAKRKGKTITEKNFIWKFYKKIWNNLVFLRPLIFSVLRILHRKSKRN